MFNVNTTLSYGLRLLLNLASNGNSPKQLKAIAREENISLGYLRKLINSLDRAGLVKSTRGPGGGFVLNREPGDIQLLQVIGIFSQDKVMDCIKGSSKCTRHSGCAVKELLEEAYGKFKLVFKDKTLATILKQGVQ